VEARLILERFRLDGKVAIVTGAGRGIGRAIALALGEAGADVVCAARTAEQIDGTADALRALGRRALAVPCDVNDRAQLESLVQRATGELGRLDVLVNNAGGSPPSPALQTEEKAFEAAFHFNVTTAFSLSQLAIPALLAAGGGAIVNVSSALSHYVEPGFVAYGTAKAALNHMTRMLAAEFAPRVRANAMAVGSIETDALSPFLAAVPDLRGKMEAMTPMRRLGQPEDVAALALYLASPASSWVTGKLFEVDGGTVASNWPLPLTKPPA
jgi:7-alpha-hydroxysteroid dehydrogenase